MESLINVIKRDKTTEPLQPDKFMHIARAAGLTDNESILVAQKIEDLVRESASKNNNSIESQDIRNIMVDELEKINPRAAGLYKWYEKTKYQSASNS